MDETLDRPVLVQAFALGHPYGPEIVDAARRAALVEDPRLQRVLAAGEERGTAYVVLERLSGRTLVELLGTGALPAELARRVVGEAAQALDRAAARGLHHLRLRPTSLVVGADGGVTVVGTAIDAAADGAESPNTAVATRSDAVGLVALLYAALTGRWPGAQDAGLARAPRVAGRPVPPGDLVAGVPNDLDTLCAVALGPHEDGPRTPGELAGQLSPWAAAAPLTDPRGLHLGGPVRPLLEGDPALLPVEAQPAEAPARRTPAWGLRVHRRGRPGADTGSQPAVPSPVPVPPVAPAADGSSAAPGQPGLEARSSAAADQGGPEADEARGAETNARPAWATVEELRRALRRTGAAVQPGAAAVPAPGAGLPLAASAPPAGPPLSAAAAPAGAPLADAVPPPGAPTAAPVAAGLSEPLATVSAHPPAPAGTSTSPGEADAVPQNRAGAGDEAREGAPTKAAEDAPTNARDDAREESRNKPREDVPRAPRNDAPRDAAPPDDSPREEAPTGVSRDHAGPQASAEAGDRVPLQPVSRGRGSRRERAAARRGAAAVPPPVPPAAPPLPGAPDPAATAVMPPVDAPAARSTPTRAVPVGSVPSPAVPVGSGPVGSGPGGSVPVASVPVASVPVDWWHGNGRGDGYAPDSRGVEGLERFAADAPPADPFEPVAPFGPEVPLSRPPREQSRLVLLIVAVLLVVVGVVAFRQLLSFHPASLITPGGGAPATPAGARPTSSASAAPTTSATAGPSPAASPVAIAGVQALDPQGDDSENNDLAARAIDGDTGSAWRSERYDNAQFGGIKKGVGLAVDLGDPVRVSSVTLTAPGSGGLVELRSADSPDYDGSSRIARGRIDGSGRVALSPGKPVTTRYLIVWFTRAPQQSNGENRVLVDEIDVR